MPYQNVTMTKPQYPPFDRRTWPAESRVGVWPAPDGWPLRRFDLGEGARGRLLFLGGRGDMIEKYLEPMVHWASAGWRVTSFDWRGQGGSGRLAADEMVGHATDFGLWIEDLKALHAQWLAEGGSLNKHGGPQVVVAHSMGGHLALRAMAEGAIAPDAAVMIAPMWGLNAGPLPSWVGEKVSAMLARLGDPARPAWKSQEKPMSSQKVRHMLLTHCPDRYADEMWWRAHTPEIALGPPSWNWVAQAYRSTRGVERSSAIERIDVPMLILGTQADKLVSPAAIERIAKRLPDARLHMYGAEAAHEILRESDAVRIDALRRIDAFLEERAPRR